MLGFSVYLDKDLTADDHNYLLGMRNAGFKEVFTSLTGLKDEADIVLKRLDIAQPTTIPIPYLRSKKHNSNNTSEKRIWISSNDNG